MDKNEAIAKAALEGLGDRLKEAIAAKGTTKTMLAKKMGISPNTTTGWTRGIRYPDGYSVVLLCYYLGVSADWLLGLSEEGGPEAPEEDEPQEVNRP